MSKNNPKVKIDLLKKGAFLTIGDGIEKTWAVSDEELLVLWAKLNKLRLKLASRVGGSL